MIGSWCKCLGCPEEACVAEQQGRGVLASPDWGSSPTVLFMPLMAACTQSGLFIISLLHGVLQGYQLLQLKSFNPYTCVCVCVCLVLSDCKPEL